MGLIVFLVWFQSLHRFAYMKGAVVDRSLDSTLLRAFHQSGFFVGTQDILTLKITVQDYIAQ
jgi:hypothetical protein